MILQLDFNTMSARGKGQSYSVARPLLKIWDANDNIGDVKLEQARKYLDGLAGRLAVGHTMNGTEEEVVNGCFAAWSAFMEDEVLDKDARLRSC